MIPSLVKIKNDSLPDSPGVYLMKDEDGVIIYVGKATSLKRRVSSYFQRPHDARIQEMVSNIRSIDYVETSTVLEALILEANLIKHYFPHYNIKEKDNRSFLYLVITKEEYPRPLFIRGSDLEDDAAKRYKAVFGPYTQPRAVRAALDLIRKVIPWSTCVPGRPRACFYVHLKQCPGVCIGAITPAAYGKIIRQLILFFEGKKGELLTQYRREMKAASKAQRFEEAAEMRNKIFFLEHIQDVAIMKREEPEIEASTEEGAVNLFGRIEGYDISNISGTSSVASMVVFERGAPAKAEYRKFRIKTVEGSNDVASMREVLIRRFRNSWRRPNLILIDGGWPQVNTAIDTLRKLNVTIPVVGLAKGPNRDKDELICPADQTQVRAMCEKHPSVLIAVRDESHRFAITYHRKLRSMKMKGERL